MLPVQHRQKGQLPFCLIRGLPISVLHPVREVLYPLRAAFSCWYSQYRRVPLPAHTPLRLRRRLPLFYSASECVYCPATRRPAPRVDAFRHHSMALQPSSLSAILSATICHHFLARPSLFTAFAPQISPCTAPSAVQSASTSQCLTPQMIPPALPGNASGRKTPNLNSCLLYPRQRHLTWRQGHASIFVRR